MKTKDFLARVIPDDGLYYVASLNKSGNMLQRKAETLEEVMQKIKTMHNSHKHVFFATASFTDGEKGRIKANVRSKKSLYLDLDCGPNKEFPTKKDAMRAFVQFSKDARLPPPSLIVDSGNGWHIYYIFPTLVSPNDWIAMATGLKELCVTHMFPADSVCTSDSVRVLRVPGTLNWKDPENPKPCKVFRESKDVEFLPMFKLLTGATKTPALRVVPNVPALDNEDLALPKRKYDAPAIDDVFARCATMAHSLKTGGKDDNEALWQYQLHVLAHLDDGAKYIHKISDQYPTYDARETERKFETKIKAVESGNTTGPTGCKAFSTTLGNKCSDCKYYGKAKNPIHAARLRMPNELPSNYKDEQDGTYQYDSDAEEWIRIFEYKISDVSINRPKDDITSYFRMTVVIGQSKPNKIDIPLNEILDFRTFINNLAIGNMLLHVHQQKAIWSLIVDWASQMMKAKSVTSIPNRLGWANVNKRRGFSLSNTIIWDDGTTDTNAISDKQIIDQYTPIGKFEKWREAADLVTGNPNIELQVALATAFAAPLMKILNTPGALLALVSPHSGIGKSMALETAQAVWGDPKGINNMDDTHNAIMKRLGLINNMPAYWDEVILSDATNHASRFVNALFRMAQGKEKTRLKANSELMASGSWATIITIATNDSVSDHVALHRSATSAGDMRLLELVLDSPKYINDENELGSAAIAFANLHENYGTAGEKYANVLVRNYDKIRNTLTKQAAQLALNPKLKGTGQTQRMRVALTSAIIVGAMIAKTKGICDFNVDAIKQRLLLELCPEVDSKGKVKEKRITGKSCLREYITEFADHINKSEDFSRPGKSSIQTISPPMRLPAHMHVADVRDRIRLEPNHFSNWVTSKYGCGSRIVKELKDDTSLGCTSPRSNLDAGLKSSIDAKRARLIEVNIP